MTQPMVWMSVAVLNGVIALCYFGIVAVIVRGLHATEQMWTNRLATATAAIFFTCAVHHGAHTLHLVGPEFGFQVEHGLRMREVFAWPMAAWDLVGAAVAVYYLTLRRSYAKLLDAPVLFSAVPFDSAERRLALLSEAADDRALVLLGPDGEIRDWPAAATALTGVGAADAEGRPAVEQVAAWGTLVLDPAARTEAELHVGGQEQEHWLEATCTPVRGSGEELLGWGVVLRDLTATRRAAAELRTAHGMLRSVLDAATGSAVVATDLEGTITLFNAGAERMLGHGAEELVGHADQLLLHDPDEVAAAARAAGLAPGFAVLALSAREGRAETRDWTYVRRDGSRLTVALTVTPTHGAAGELTGFLLVAIDVTAARRDERLMRAHGEVAHALAFGDATDAALEAALAALTGAGPWAVAQLWETRDGTALRRRASWSADPASAFVADSAELTFAPGEGFPGAAFAAEGAVFSADVRADPRTLRAAAARADGLGALVVVPVGGRDGLVGALEVVAAEQRVPGAEEIAALTATGRLIGLYLERQAAVAAITEQAERHAVVLDALCEGVVTYDEQLRAVSANPAASRILGVPEEDVLDRATVAAALADAPGTGRWAVGEALTSPEGIRDRLVELSRPDGERRWALMSAAPFTPERTGARGVVASLVDVTAQHEAETELRTKTIELERSNLDLEHFASVASHDLQEPLRKIQTFGDQLQRRCGADLDERGQLYVERMQAAATRMRTLIEDLLSYSRVTSLARPFTEVDLAGVVAEVLDDLEEAVDAAGAEVRVGELGCLDADRTQMRQLLQNLIANAIKFQRPGVPPVVEVHTTTCEAGRLQLVVEDNGIGFDAQYAERIFGIFERLHGRQDYAGTGIGLAVCRKIAIRHGGDVTATGSPGSGARFVVDLPAHHAAGAPVPA